MGKVRSHLENLQGQIKFVEQTMAVLAIQDHQAVMSEQHRQLFTDILSNLKMIQNWVCLPDYHQAALQTLDSSYQLRERLRTEGKEYSNAFDILVQLLAHLRKINNNMSQAEQEELLQLVGDLSLIGIARFIVPTKTKTQ